jgi:hypothetical protein
LNEPAWRALAFAGSRGVGLRALEQACELDQLRRKLRRSNAGHEISSRERLTGKFDGHVRLLQNFHFRPLFLASSANGGEWLEVAADEAA